MRKKLLIATLGIILMASTGAAIDINSTTALRYYPDSNLEFQVDTAGNIDALGSLTMNGNNIVNPNQVDGVDLDNPGNAISVNGDQLQVDSNSIDDNEIADNVVDNTEIQNSDDFTFNQVNVKGTNDGKLDLTADDVGSTSGTAEGGWNYIEFRDAQSDRQGYFGIDSGGNFQFTPQVSGAEVQVESDLSLQGNTLTSIGGLQNCGSNEFVNGNGNCETDTDTDTDNQNLAEVLSQGNSTGSYDINVNNNNIDDVASIDGGGDAIQFNDNLAVNNNNIDDVASIDGGGDAVQINDQIQLNNNRLKTGTGDFIDGSTASFSVIDSGSGGEIDVQDNMELNGNPLEGINQLRDTTDTARVEFDSSNAEVNVINSDVGIGTSTPQEDLDVNGDARVRGDLDVWGNITNTQVNNLNVNGSILPPPDYNGTFDIGSSSRMWRRGYFSGTVYASNFQDSDSGDSISDTYVDEAGDTMSGILNMGTYRITSLGDPTNAQDAATKSYVDNNDATGTDDQTLTVNTDVSGTSDEIQIESGNTVTIDDDYSANTDASTKCGTDEVLEGGNNCVTNYEAGDDGDSSSTNERQGISASGDTITIYQTTGETTSVDSATITDDTGTDDQTLGEVLNQGNTANQNINMSGNSVQNVNQVSFNSDEEITDNGDLCLGDRCA